MVHKDTLYWTHYMVIYGKLSFDWCSIRWQLIPDIQLAEELRERSLQRQTVTRILEKWGAAATPLLVVLSWNPIAIKPDSRLPANSICCPEVVPMIDKCRFTTIFLDLALAEKPLLKTFLRPFFLHIMVITSVWMPWLALLELVSLTVPYRRFLFKLNFSTT
jgi:hypothetical protein